MKIVDKMQAVIAADDPRHALQAMLGIIQSELNFDGVSITHYGDIYFHEVMGDESLWGDAALFQKSWEDLPLPLTANANLGRAVQAKFWYTYRPTGNFLICLWCAQAQPPIMDDTELQMVLHALMLSAKLYLAHQQQARATLLANSVLNSILDPVLVLSDEKHVVTMNVAAERVLGVQGVAARGQSLEQVVQDETLIDAIHESQQYDYVGRPVEWTTGENGEFTFLPSLTRVETPDGMQEEWVIALRDVSRFKRMNRNQREFMRIVSHDLRSPLTSMQGFADMIRMGMAGPVTEKQVYFVDKILSGIDQMTSIVENIQDAGRFDPETGFYEMQRSHIDVGEIAAKIIENHILPAEKQNLQLTLRVAEDVPIINADENMITRALTNLVDNAIKYTPDDGQVVVDIHHNGSQLIMSVVDDGYGISEEDQKRLFQRHVRLARKEHAKVKGTGLGLFIVRSVALSHGGDATVHSTLGEGTTFSIVIPLAGINLIRG